MKIANAAAFSLIFFTVCASAYLFVRPIFVKPPQIVTDRNLEYIGKSPKGESAYVVAKEEITYWIQQLAKLTPTVTSLGAAFILYKRFKRECKEKNNEK